MSTMKTTAQIHMKDDFGNVADSTRLPALCQMQAPLFIYLAITSCSITEYIGGNPYLRAGLQFF
jgi:hypothetical protein